jgi:hypothetical protein
MGSNPKGVAVSADQDGDLLVGLPFGDELQHLDLEGGELDHPAICIPSRSRDRFRPSAIRFVIAGLKNNNMHKPRLTLAIPAPA